MQIPLQVTIRGMAASPAIVGLLHDKVKSLEHFQRHIMNCRVIVSKPHRHHDRGAEFEVSVEVRARGHLDVVVNGQCDADIQVAVRDAFDAVVRKLTERVNSFPRGAPALGG